MVRRSDMSPLGSSLWGISGTADMVKVSRFWSLGGEEDLDPTGTRCKETLRPNCSRAGDIPSASDWLEEALEEVEASLGDLYSPTSSRRDGKGWLCAEDWASDIGEMVPSALRKSLCRFAMLATRDWAESEYVGKGSRVGDEVENCRIIVLKGSAKETQKYEKKGQGGIMRREAT